MLKMTGSVVWCCAALILLSTSVSAFQRLNSINDLKTIDFGGSVPKHSLVLLYWFASTVNFRYDNCMELPFDPNTEDYGSHHYGNYEGLLPRGQFYYTIGSLQKETSVQLPSYVLNPPTLNEARNRDRIIVAVRGTRIQQVYITQHYGHEGNEYDPSRTYEITTNLLREIRAFSVGGNYQQLSSLRNRYGSNADVSSIGNTWGELAGLVLFLSIVTTTTTMSFTNQNRSRQGYDSTWNRSSSHLQSSAWQDDGLWETCSALCRMLGILILVVFFLIFVLAIASLDKRPRY